MNDKQYFEGIKDIVFLNENDEMLVKKEAIVFLINQAEMAEIWKGRYLEENEKVLKLVNEKA